MQPFFFILERLCSLEASLLLDELAGRTCARRFIILLFLKLRTLGLCLVILFTRFLSAACLSDFSHWYPWLVLLLWEYSADGLCISFTCLLLSVAADICPISGKGSARKFIPSAELMQSINCKFSDPEAQSPDIAHQQVRICVARFSLGCFIPIEPNVFQAVRYGY